MFGFLSGKGGFAQISLEFLIVYSFVLVIFILMFSIIATQRAASLGQQQYSLLQSQAQTIASSIDQAASSGSGYSVSIPILSGFSEHSYNISISTTGVIILGTKVGSQPIMAYGFSSARDLVVNGTLEDSANGISIYQLYVANGNIGIANSKGIIYINEQPPSVSSLAQGAVVTQIANVKAAQFNGASSYININNPARLNPPNQITVSAWVNTNSLSGVPRIISSLTLSPYNGWELLMESGRIWFQVGNGGTIQYANSAPITTATYYFVVATYDGTTGKIYINGVLQSSTFSASSAIGSSSEPIDIGTWPGNPAGNYWSGYIANIQVYNTSLNANQINALYNEGIGGAPINTQNSVAWWPLNGNSNDYSGYSNDGTPTDNVQYQSVIQVNANVISYSNTINDTLLGYISSIGSLSGTGGSSAISHTVNSLSGTFVTSNGYSGSGILSSYPFNGNISTQNTLVGWWPLDTGYGNVIYDISGSYINGNFIGSNWIRSANQTNFIAAYFPGNPGGIMGNNLQDGFIKINSSQSLLSIANNDTFTTVAWIYYNGPTASHNQGVFGDWPGSGAGFQILGYCNSCANGAALYINNSYVPFPNGLDSFPENTLEMVTAEYNGTTGLATIYLNNTLFASNNVGKGLGLAQMLPYYIGDDASQPSGLDTFNGRISNVQLYAGYLSMSQIGRLYAEGAASNPISDAGLGWWPLAGNARDYSSNNTGVVQYNVSFKNMNYTNYVGSQQSKALFNGNGGYVAFQNVPQLQLSTLTLSGWVDYKGPSPGSWNWMAAKQYAWGVGACGSSLDVCYYDWSTSTAYNSGFLLSKNIWYFMVATINGTANTETVYINGNKVMSGHLTVGSQAYPFEIGYGNGASQFLNGSAVDVQVYNAVLTQQQIMQLYQQGIPSNNRLNISLG